MTVWVTGAKGFIGQHLVRLLADGGYTVHGIGHGALEEFEKERIGLEFWVNGDVDAANLNALAEKSGLPSTIFHLAGGSSVGSSIIQPLEDFSRNVSSMAQLLEWLRGSASHCRLIVASSAAVYGSEHDGPISENAELSPMSPYGQHKMMMEQLCSSYATTFGLRSTVVRLFSVYGPCLRKQLLWDVCSRLQRRVQTLVMSGTGREVRDWIDVRDCVRLFVKIAELSQGETFQVINGGSGRETTVSEITNMIVSGWGANTSVQFSGTARQGDPFSLISDDAKLRRLCFDWRIPVNRGVSDYVSWFKDQAR